jgi:hypothetical protein
MPAGILEVIVENKNPLPGLRWQRVWESFCAFLTWFCQRCEHDRQPATNVVVMPGVMDVLDVAKHCSGLIPECP